MNLTLYTNTANGDGGRVEDEVREVLGALGLGDAALHVVDVSQDGDSARRQGILVTPTLVREGGERVQRAIGEFTDAAAVAEALGLPRPGDRAAPSDA